MGKIPDILIKKREMAITRITEHLAAQGNFFKVSWEENSYPESFKDFDIWKRLIKSKNGESWWVYIIFSDTYPIDPPIIHVPEASHLYLENPHVIENGFLCILSDSSSINSEEVEDVFNYFINSTKKILSGTSDTDFKEEFTSYWNRKVSDIKKQCLIISSPEIIEKKFNVFWGESYICISHNNTELNRWCSNFLSDSTEFSLQKNGVTLQIHSPLIPSEYPESCFDVLALARNKDIEAYKILINIVINTSERILLLLIQNSTNGFSLGGIELRGLKLKQFTKLQQGFRRGNVPDEILINRASSVLKSEKVYRYKVMRADYNWIHSRGGDGSNFNNKSIAVIGCGSLGGYIAHLLAKSGVGKMLLIDKETLEWANIGRHILGADYVGAPKAHSLRKQLLKEMPHLDIKSENKNWLKSFNEDSHFFNDYDCVVVSIADWKHEKPLNLLSKNKHLPPVIFTWLEPFAVAGHCLIPALDSGCIECYMNDLGQFALGVSEFTENSLLREPGGCTYYQPYGPTALMSSASMACKYILSFLGNRPSQSTLYSSVSDEGHFKNVKAEISNYWKKRLLPDGYSKIHNTILDTKRGCRACLAEKNI